MDFLTVITSSGTSLRHEIDREVFRIGRSSASHLILEDPHVSRDHAEISRGADNSSFLADLKTRNGTFLNGREITEAVRLQPGDRIRLGDTVLIFNASAPTSVEFGHQPVSDGAQTTVVPAHELRSPESEELALWLDSSAPGGTAAARGLKRARSSPQSTASCSPTGPSRRSWRRSWTWRSVPWSSSAGS